MIRGQVSKDQVYSDSPDVAGSRDSPRDMSPQSDYYKFVWQEDEDFGSCTGATWWHRLQW